MYKHSQNTYYNKNDKTQCSTVGGHIYKLIVFVDGNLYIFVQITKQNLFVFTVFKCNTTPLRAIFQNFCKFITRQYTFIIFPDKDKPYSAILYKYRFFFCFRYADENHIV